MRNAVRCWYVSLIVALAASSCGKAKPLSVEGLLGAAVLEGTGGTRTDGSGSGDIYSVTTVIEATSGLPWTAGELPFTGTPSAIGQSVLNAQTAIRFQYTYPPNNYKLSSARLIIDTSRDTSDTEGIFVDGVFSGAPPTGNINTSSPKITHKIYQGNTSGLGMNVFYNKWSIEHYKQLTRNTFDLDMALLLTPTTVKASDLLSDGDLPVVTGDDSPVYQAFLNMKGVTISSSPLTCSQSQTYTYQNVFLHNDGNSIAQAAFNGTAYGPFDSWAVTSHDSVEFWYDAQLPRVNLTNITIGNATIAMGVKRHGLTRGSAIVVNGIGVSTADFDRTAATSAVEQWDNGSAQTYWESWLASVPSTGTAQTVTLDLVALLGANRLRLLLNQGKLNLAFAGDLRSAQASEDTHSAGGVPLRVTNHTVSGPELSLSGTYFTNICQVPNNPSSPLNDSSTAPPVTGDQTSPIASSISAGDVTSSSATIRWLTNEPANSQIAYGIGGNTSTLSTLDASYTDFHEVTLTGLQPYKVYTFKVRTADQSGNLTESGMYVFQTLR